MKSTFRFKFLLLVAVMALLFAPTIDAQVIQPVAHYIASITPEHVLSASASLAVLPLAMYVKENRTISADELSALALKFGRIKILSVVIDAPIYNLIYKGIIYDYSGNVIERNRLLNERGNFDYTGDLYDKDKNLIPDNELFSITDPGEIHYYAVRRPDAPLVRMLTVFVEKNENQKYIDACIKNLVVAGDMDLLESDGTVYLGLVGQIKDMMKPYQSFLEKA